MVFKVSLMVSYGLLNYIDDIYIFSNKYINVVKPGPMPILSQPILARISLVESDLFCSSLSTVWCLSARP